jgi:enoyl-CoA hydratase/carnithine racemase
MTVELTQIGYDCANGVATLTLRRPERLNALTDTINREMHALLDEIAADDTIKLVVLTGEGRAFSAGYDLGFTPDIPDRDAAWWREHFRLAFRTLQRMWTLPQPIIAKVRGACVGGGFALSLMCDLCYASDDAIFGEPEVKFGGGTMSPILCWALPMRVFNELLLTGRTLTARRAEALGLINESVPLDQLDARVDQITRHMLLLPPETLTRNKRINHEFYDHYGQDRLAQFMERSTIASASGRPERAEDEFTRRSRIDGLSVALKWQKQQFTDVGAFV